MVDSGEVIEEITRYRDKPGARVLDLRKEGVPFVAVLSRRECRNTVAGPHLHIHPGGIEIVYCVRGILSFQTPEKEYAFLPRNIFVSRPDEPHCMVTNPKGLFVYRILVELPPQGKALAGLSLDESGWLLDRLRTLPRLYAVQDRSIRSAFECASLFMTHRPVCRDADRSPCGKRCTTCSLPVLRRRKGIWRNRNIPMSPSGYGKWRRIPSPTIRSPR